MAESITKYTDIQSTIRVLPPVCVIFDSSTQRDMSQLGDLLVATYYLFSCKERAYCALLPE
jgi:hypothetical protein